jgi:hypothetical protein
MRPAARSPFQRLWHQRGDPVDALYSSHPLIGIALPPGGDHSDGCRLRRRSLRLLPARRLWPRDRHDNHDSGGKSSGVQCSSLHTALSMWAICHSDAIRPLPGAPGMR